MPKTFLSVIFSETMCLPKKFYERDASQVAKDLLGCIIVKKDEKEILKGKIVETEAYYGLSDPASRAGKGKMADIMWLYLQEPIME